MTAKPITEPRNRIWIIRDICVIPVFRGSKKTLGKVEKKLASLWRVQ